MALALRQRQVQRQAVSPAMLMELSLLPLPIGELKEAVKKELETNPALEVATPSTFRPVAGAFRGDGDKAGLVDRLADERGETLDEHLLSELRMDGVEGRELAVCRALVSALDEDGRYAGAYGDLIMVLEGLGVPNVTEAELEAARQRVMGIDPKGCGARNLAECYRVQIGGQPPERRAELEAAIEFVQLTIDSAARRPGAEKALAKLPRPDARAMGVLKSLNAYPGRLYDSRRTEFVVPDIRLDADGEVTVDQGDLPPLRLSAKYEAMAKDAEERPEVRAYAKERVARAREFQQALARRLETMEKIAECAVGGQAGFLRQGVAGLRKLTMSEVAKTVGCDVSTVSRAAARKYVKTPRGVFPLRRFFPLVDQAPIEKLRGLLAAIPPGRHVSDQALSAAMKKAGYAMARRTVAKYRARLAGAPLSRTGIS